tara:strand:+ start:85 stop:273 length:189 start_codon:yes stop_codon:yes gene_type:complete
MIEAAIAVSLAVLGLTIHNMRCIHRIEKKILFMQYRNKQEVLDEISSIDIYDKKEIHDLDDK